MQSSKQVTSPVSAFKVIIVGGGLAGSLLANGLLNHGVETTVYERTAKDSKRDGYQITLGEPALQGFRASLSDEHIRLLVSRFGRSGGRKTRAPVVYDRDFNALIDLTRLPNYSKSAPIDRRILRDSLAEPVSERGRMQYGHPFSRYEIIDPGEPSEKVRVHFENGSHDDCHILIGADGSHSRINALVGLDNIKQLTTHWSFLVKTDLSSKDVLRVPKPVLEKQALVFANDITIYFSVYTPERRGDQSGAVADECPSSCMLGWALPVKICPANTASLSSNEQLDLLAHAIKDWAVEYHDMIDLVRGSAVYAYKARVASRPAKNWRQQARQSRNTPEAGSSRVWLLGDACHAMLPNRGMGGNQAMRDTATVLPLLVDLAREYDRENLAVDISKACSTYEAEMIPRAFEWVQKSGGETIVPIDSTTYRGRLFFALVSIVINMIAAWTRMVSFLGVRSTSDDAPELSD